MKKLIFISMLLFAYLNGYCEGVSSDVTDASCVMELGQPDLIITATTLNQSNINCGITVRVTATVKNNGNAQVGSSSYLGFYISTDTNWDAGDTFLKENYVRNLHPGQTSTELDYPFIPTHLGNGTFYLLFVADHREAKAESNENNNVNYREINIQNCDPLPDLIVNDERVYRSSVACGNNVSVSARVKNKDVATAGSSYLGYYLSEDWRWDADDIYLKRDYVSGLYPDDDSFEQESVRIPANTPPGNYYFLFVADYQGIVDERRTSNNVEWEYLTVTCGPAERQATDENIAVNNFPSPFSESTMIEFDLPEDGPVTLFVSDMTGKQVAVLLDKAQQFAGNNQVTFDASNYQSGTYYYTIQAGEYTATKKMILMK